MKELANVREALEYARGQEIDYFREIRGNDSQADTVSKQSKGDLLFFPRKKLKMQKIRSGNWEPRAWFIQDRLEERVTALDQSTNISHEGITSGLRSAIVKEPNGVYLRLKGVAPNMYKPSRKVMGSVKDKINVGMHGLATWGEAHDEQGYLLAIKETGFPYLSMRPAFVELFLQPPVQNRAEEFVREYILNHKHVNFDLKSAKSGKNQFALLDEFRKLSCSRHYGFSPAFVSAFEISADTRLDEALYELTKLDLTGDKRAQRDELAYHLAFNAGTALGFLSALGYVWSTSLGNTNSHLGNFVLDRRFGKMQVSICDLSAVGTDLNFNSKPEFWDHIAKDMELFRNDFFADYTTSHPTSLKFRHFPDELRENAFQAFKTGYSMVADHYYQVSKVITPRVVKPEKIIVPDKVIMTEHDFRRKVDFVLN